MSKSATLCLNMIVKDEAEIIEQLVDSVATHIGYYVVCDTGSTDDTVERLRNRFLGHGVDGEIHSIPFSNFSQARNCALERGRASKRDIDYFLLADADMELIVDDPKFAWDLSKPAYSVKQESGSLGYYTTRIIRANTAATYSGSTHEHLDVNEVTRLNGVRLKHHACGSSRVNKISRDFELLLNQLKENPDDARAMFYLAQTCSDAGRFREAADWYDLRTRAGGAAEESWYARYQSALCHLALKDNGKFVTECLRAYSERPWRIEPLYQLARYHRVEGLHEAARLFLTEAMNTPYPATDNLFINEEIYRSGLKEELSYAGLHGSPDLYELGRSGCYELATSATASPHTLAVARHNSGAYAVSAGMIFDRFESRKLDLQPPPGYRSLNPSITFHAGSLHAIVRTSNFMNNARSIDDDAAVHTQNFFVDLNEDLAVVNAVPMVDSTARTTYPNKVQGFEDCRLFRLRDKWFCTATVRDNDQNALCEMSLLTFDATGSIEKVHILRSPQGAHEKNWVPLVCDDELYFVYTTSPTVILRCDAQTGQFYELSRNECKLRLDHLRGGSQAIQLDDGWLYVTHEVIQSKPSRRSYLHRFVLLDRQFSVRSITDPFFFIKRGIEYCAGMTLNRDTNQLLVSFGLNDCEAFIGSLPLESVLARLIKL